MADEKVVPVKRGRPRKEEIPEQEPKKEEAKTGEYQVEIIRDYYGKADITYISKKDPEYEYRFLRDDFKNLKTKTSNLLFQKGGWQIVPREHLLKIGIKEREIAPDGMYRSGDLILAFMPKKLFKEKEKYKEDLATVPMKEIKRNIKEGIPSIGGKEIHDSMRGIQTQKQLGM